MALTECPECGKQISDQAKACPHCGFPSSKQVAGKPEIADVQESSTIKCEKCGAQMALSATRCTQCGDQPLFTIKKGDFFYILKKYYIIALGFTLFAFFANLAGSDRPIFWTAIYTLLIHVVACLLFPIIVYAKQNNLRFSDMFRIRIR